MLLKINKKMKIDRPTRECIYIFVCQRKREDHSVCYYLFIFNIYIYIYIDISKTTNRIGREEKTRV